MGWLVRRPRGAIGPVMPARVAAARGLLRRPRRSNAAVSIARRANKKASQALANVDIRHQVDESANNFGYQQKIFNTTEPYTLNNVNMTTSATANGWAANYSGGKTGCIGWVIPVAARDDTTLTHQTRTGNDLFLRSVMMNIRLLGSGTDNSNIRVLFLKVRGHIEPEDLGTIYRDTTTPVMGGFLDKGRASKIKHVLYDRTFRMVRFNETQLQQERYIKIFRRLNTRIFYGYPTAGNGVLNATDGEHDVHDGSYNFYLLALTDNSTDVTIIPHVVVNYVP